MKKTNIVIPNPCNMDWNAMTPEGNGRGCSACNKTVVDFTSMDVEQIKNYLESRKNEKVCGHFYNDQVIVSRPKHHQFLVNQYLKIESKLTTPLFRTSALSLIVFCMVVVGCNRPPAPSPAPAKKDKKDSSNNTRPPKHNRDSSLIKYFDSVCKFEITGDAMIEPSKKKRNKQQQDK